MAASRTNDESTFIPTSYGLLLFPGFEVLDAAGPIEALNVLSLHLNHQEIKLSVIARTIYPVSPGPFSPNQASSHFTGQQFYQPSHTFDTAPPLDVLIVPGGRGCRGPKEELQPVLDFIHKSYNGSDNRPPLTYLFSICTGSWLCAMAGVLDGHRATTNKKAWGLVTPHFPKTHWMARARWVTSGNIWTTSGVSAGIDGMVAFISTIYGEKTAQDVCDTIEHSRVKEAGDDPFAELNGCEDVLPRESI